MASVTVRLGMALDPRHVREHSLLDLDVRGFVRVRATGLVRGVVARKPDAAADVTARERLLSAACLVRYL